MSRREGWAVALAILLWLGFLAGLRPLALPDEGRYVGVAWEMLRSGQWLVPTLDGLPFFHKPPLFYWLTAAALSLFGPTLWAARLASLLGAAVAAVALHGFVARRSDAGTARCTVLVLLTQPFFYVGAQFANLDMLVAGCISVAILAAASAALEIEQGRPARGALAGAYAALALGLLAKGLIGALLPALTILAWLLWTRRWRLLGRLLWLPGLLLFALIALPWVVEMQRRYPAFFDYFIVEQHLRRYVQGGFNNPQPFWFYAPVLLLLSLPWSGWLLATLRRPALAAPADDPQRLRVLMWIWLGVIVVFFSLPRSKLVGYVLPALPPLAWLVADGLRVRYGPQPLAARPVRWSVALAALACVTAVVVAAHLQQSRSSLALAAVLGAERRAGEPVLMLDRYVYELSFYGRLDGPAVVALDWEAARREGRDNWRKELIDAARFDTARASTTLIPREGVAAALCAARSASWLVGASGAPRHYPVLAQATLVAQQGELMLWKLQRTPTLLSVLACPQTPSDGSANK